ncbi:MAG: DUF1549 and DUF1553 domain-containing protein [Verrucomicrobiales bacterium]|nr:DUF1549 and DUF1553 domain-containing protein [Verrucomicrobiales bacterium]
MTPLCHIPIPVIIAVLFGTAIAPLSAQNAEKWASHWSLQPVSAGEVPGDENPIDYFISQKLSDLGVEQNPEADLYTLLRRATIDLTGLPPTREEIAAFTADESPDAYEKLVDRLLGSPHYGERWGRHWLDIARYVQGAIKVPGIDEIDLAIPYRDYVVKSFNEDKPFDRFVTEQLAGDILAENAETASAYLDAITAPAFLSIGQWFEECTDPNKLRLDIIDEQISTTTRAFLAMDFACSRCHDHKFDPIPTADYYAMAGMFRSTRITSDFSEEWKDGRPRAVQRLVTTQEERGYLNKETELRQLASERAELLSKVQQRLLSEGRPEIPASEIFGDHIFSFEAENFDGHKNLKVVSFGGKQEALASRRQKDQWAKYRIPVKEPGDYQLLVRFRAEVPSPVDLEINGTTLDEQVLVGQTSGEGDNGFRWAAIALPELKRGSNYIRFKVAQNEPFPTLDRGIVFQREKTFSNSEILAAFWPPSIAEAETGLNESESRLLESIDKRTEELRIQASAFPVTLAVSEEKAPISLPVHVNGETYQQKGDPVPRAAPSLADDLISTSYPVPDGESGRLQLAQWLTDPNHPLTARVLVNRLWHWHFGTGIVRTADDFGIQGSPPTHPELLDWLAAELMRNDWSIKHIHRLIMKSDTYRASSAETPTNREKDPDGVFLSRYPRHRLEAEAIYDGMLTSIGKVERQPSGEPLDTNLSKDRALYILTSSRSPKGLGLEIRKMLKLFGYDESGRPMHDRDESITAKQALFWLNNPVPKYYADQLAEKLVAEHPDNAARLEAANELTLGRPLREREKEALLAYFSTGVQNGLSETESLSRVCLALFSSSAFSHLE